MNTQTKRWLMVIIAIVLNCLANAMMGYAALGNTYWGIAAQNISDYTGIQFGTSILLIMLGLFVYNRIALRQYRLVLDTLSLIITICSGTLINIFFGMLESTIDLSNNIILTNIIWLVGLLLMTMSISMYLKPNLIVPAMDENMGVFAKLYFNMDFAKAGYLAMAVAMVITVVVGFLNDKTFLGFNVYSIVVIVVFGHLINFFTNNMKMYDKFIKFGEFAEIDEVEAKTVTE